MTWTMAIYHEERKKTEIRVVSWMDCACRPLHSLEGRKRGLVDMSLEETNKLTVNGMVVVRYNNSVTHEYTRVY